MALTIVESAEFTLAFEHSGANILYAGKAPPGTAKSAAGWQIRKFLYTGNDLVDVQYANGSKEFVHVWNDRASYGYS